MTENSAEERLFQVVFDLEQVSPTWPPVSSERLWAAKTGVRRQLAVRNVPFYVKGIAYGDVIAVTPDDARREILFDRLVEESGHSTVRLLVHRPEVRGTVLQMLEQFGVTWEESNVENHLAADVPPECDYARLRELLIAARDRGDVGVEEGAVSSLHQALLPTFP